MIARPSGQSEAWNRGFDWATHQGPHHDLGIDEALDAWGYDFDTPDEAEFMRGSEYGLNERGRELSE